MRYLSTRNHTHTQSFTDAVLEGLAPDGGLYIPEAWPQLSPSDIAALRGLPFTETAFRVMRPFVDDALPDATLRTMIDASYGAFRHTAVTPLVQVDDHAWLLELFHGPTLAFKDVALQFLGRLLDALLEHRGQRATILGATSGDTGSAAIEGCRGRERMQIFILHPKGRVSDVQRRQMTTVTDANVHNLAIEGSFDDCQALVKALFADRVFNARCNLSAVNSINWARIMAQVVYYFHAAVHLGAPAVAPVFAVPTGNFGDIFAGYVAKRMGLPVGGLIIGSNRNDILTRFLETGAYRKESVHPTMAPSIDIQVASNFERLLFDALDRDSARLQDALTTFQETGSLQVESSVLAGIRQDFSAARASEEEVLATMGDVYRHTGLLIDPHTAVGVHAGRTVWRAGDRTAPLVTLATAHPAKFPDAVTRATGRHLALPVHLKDLMEREERYDTLPNDAAAVKAYMETRVT